MTNQDRPGAPIHDFVRVEKFPEKKSSKRRTAKRLLYGTIVGIIGIGVFFYYLETGGLPIASEIASPIENTINRVTSSVGLYRGDNQDEAQGIISDSDITETLGSPTIETAQTVYPTQTMITPGIMPVSGNQTTAPPTVDSTIVPTQNPTALNHRLEDYIGLIIEDEPYTNKMHKICLDGDTIKVECELGCIVNAENIMSIKRIEAPIPSVKVNTPGRITYSNDEFIETWSVPLNPDDPSSQFAYIETDMILAGADLGEDGFFTDETGLIVNEKKIFELKHAQLFLRPYSIPVYQGLEQCQGIGG